MYFSRIELNRSGPGLAKLLKALSADDYRHHQFIWRLFSREQERNFLYRRQDAGKWPRYYAVSAHEPQDDENLWTVETKPYAPIIEKGMTLAFSLRANPVVTRKNGNGKRARHDVVMDYKKRIGYKTRPAARRPALPEIMREAGLGWLESRAERHGFGFEAERVTVDGYEQHRSLKRRGEQSITFSTLDFGGVLAVKDSEVFRNALFTGIGPAKGLGCGMLMVRRS